MDLLCAAPKCRGTIETAAAHVELQKRDTVSTPCIFSDACSQPPLSCAQRHWSLKYLTECKYADTSIPDMCARKRVHEYRNTIKV